MKKTITILTLLVVSIITGCQSTNPIVHVEYHEDINGKLVKYTVTKNAGSKLSNEQIKQEAAPIIAYMRALHEQPLPQ